MAIKTWEKLLYPLVICITGLSWAIFITINSFFLFRMTINAQMTKLVGMTAAKIMKNYYQLIMYLEFPWVKDLKLSDFPFSIHGYEHMHEVKNLFLLNFGILVAFTILCIIMYSRVRKNNSWWILVMGLRNMLIIIPMIVFFLTLNFDYWFVMFHKLFFRNNYWIFDPVKDPIINVLPDSFFTICFISIFVLLEIYLIISFIIVKRKMNQEK